MYRINCDPRSIASFRLLFLKKAKGQKEPDQAKLKMRITAHLAWITPNQNSQNPFGPSPLALSFPSAQILRPATRVATLLATYTHTYKPGEQ